MAPSIKKGFSYQFTPKEFFHFLFGMKCPRCGKKMFRTKDYNIIDGTQVNSKSDTMFVPGAEVKRYYYSYRCPDCGYVEEIGKNEKPK